MTGDSETIWLLISQSMLYVSENTPTHIDTRSHYVYVDYYSAAANADNI